MISASFAWQAWNNILSLFLHTLFHSYTHSPTPNHPPTSPLTHPVTHPHTLTHSLTCACKYIYRHNHTQTYPPPSSITVLLLLVAEWVNRFVRVVIKLRIVTFPKVFFIFCHITTTTPSDSTTTNFTGIEISLPNAILLLKLILMIEIVIKPWLLWGKKIFEYCSREKTSRIRASGWRQREKKKEQGFEDNKHFRRIKPFARFVWHTNDIKYSAFKTACVSTFFCVEEHVCFFVK